MTNMLSPLTFQKAELLPGLIKDRFDINRRYMLSLHTHNILQNHYLEAGLWAPLHKPENAHWGWESPTSQVRGEFLGTWLSAAAQIYAGTKDPEIKGKADFIVSEVARCQDENGGEWAGSIPEKYLDWLARGKKVMAPHCTVYRNMMGLYDMYARAANTQALEVLVKWARWFYRWTANFTRDQFDDILDIETGGMLEVWANLYGVTGEKEHYELIKRYDRRRLFDPLISGEDVLTNMHANTTVPEIHGAARAWEVTGEERWRRVVEAYWRSAVIDRGFYCTGGQTNREIWSSPQQLSSRLGDQTQEHCVVYNMMRLADYLLRWTGDVSYADYWERNLYNGVLAQQNPETGMVSYFLPLRSGSVKRWGTPLDHFWCCHGTLVQAQTMYLENIFYEKGDNLVLTQYIPSRFELTKNGNRVSLVVSKDSQWDSHQRPANQAYTIQVSCDLPQEFTLELRLPWWLSTTPTIQVNNEKQTVTESHTGFIPIQKVWQDDTIHLELPQSLYVCPLPDMPDTIAFMEGPIVLAGILDDGSRRGKNSFLNGKSITIRKGNPTAILIPDDERTPSRWLYGYRTRDQAVNIRFIPLYEVCDERFGVYFQINELL